MKFLLLVIAITSPVAMAAQMEGFGSNYYHDDPSITNFDTNKVLAPEVIVGDNAYVMEFSSLTDIAKNSGVVVSQDDQAAWICLTSKNSSYWFISDNEMGQGSLTSIAIANAEQQKGCSPYSADLSISIKGIPLLNTSIENISSTFSGKPDGNIIQYCNDTKKYGDFTQMNCLQYYIENNSVNGVFISQITSN